ncbi:MAG TPA: hypothetical protein PK544_12100 [Spirochaetota bacterium]|nr:hypothetical protein [Spirochaetota bacterium]HPJ37512.1 hypothetical protein [Spirochaetota bacterium]HPQ51679.1 hypothetical protein [Spirochaetota bacterium]
MAKNKIALLSLIAVLVCIYCFVFGESGVLERYVIENKSETVERRIKKLKFENELLLKSLIEYKDGRVSKEDYIRSGYADIGEKIIFFHGSASDNTIKSETERESVQSVRIDTKHLRIMWIVISSLVLVLFYIKIRKND